MIDLSRYPGGDLVSKGLADLQRGVHSEEALLLLIAEPRLTSLGLTVGAAPGVDLPYEHVLYSMIEERLPVGAHFAYNALIQRIVSFAQAYAISPDAHFPK